MNIFILDIDKHSCLGWSQ